MLLFSERHRIPSRPLVSIRCNDGIFPLGLRTASVLRGDFPREIVVFFDHSGAETFDNDTLHTSLSEVFNAQIENQPNFQVSSHGCVGETGTRVRVATRLRGGWRRARVEKRFTLLRIARFVAGDP